MCQLENVRYEDGDLYLYGQKLTDHDHSLGYVRVCLNGKSYYKHRVVWYLHHGEWPPEVEHRDTDKKNNRIENLRVATKSQNQANVMRKPGISGYVGVAKNSRGWRGSVTKDGRRYRKTFSTAIQAARWRDRKAVELFGEYARLNNV